MYGPPGTGKTLLSRAVANQAKARLFVVTPSAINRRYMGEKEAIIAALFAAVNIFWEKI